jgi:hypothetical protein
MREWNTATTTIVGCRRESHDWSDVDMAIDTDRATLHALVDAVPDERLKQAIAAVRLLTIPEDDEPVTDEDREAIRRGREAYLHGELIPHEDVMREFGL